MSDSLSPHRPTFLHKLPWEKIAIWSIFLGIIYILRHFFFIIFLTFLLSYSMRLLVVRLCRPFEGNRWRGWIETGVAFLCFLSLVFSLYGIGSLIIPQLAEQGQALTKRIANPQKSPQAQFDEYLTKSFGAWLFQQKYGDRSSSRYLEAFGRFRSPEQQREHFRQVMGNVEQTYEDFLAERHDISAKFGTTPNKSNLLKSPEHPAIPSPETPSLEEWVLRERAPQRFAGDRAGFTRAWEDFYRKQEFQIPGLTPLTSLTPSEREGAILRFVTTTILADESARSALITAWEQAKSRNLVLNLRRQNPVLSDELFANYFDRIKDDLPYTLEEYRTLRTAAEGPLSAFQKALDSLHPGESAERRDRRERNAFERRERAALYTEWKKGEVAGKLQEKLEEHAIALMTSLGSSIGQIVPKLLLFPMQLFTALLLSFLITIDVPRLRAGLEKLSHTRFRHVYWEIKPGLVSFGLLIGRAFQAQGLIAVVNAVLTWIAIHFLGIQNAAFLCFIVFLCSFVPVLGVVFSSVPIAIMAITQDGGSLALALWSIAAILFIHFLETSIFNPRIVGNMLHLHPVLVLAILAICEHFFGVWGLLLGVPVFVYIIRFVILQEGIPGFLEMKREDMEGNGDDEQ